MIRSPQLLYFILFNEIVFSVGTEPVLRDQAVNLVLPINFYKTREGAAGSGRRFLWDLRRLGPALVEEVYAGRGAACVAVIPAPRTMPKRLIAANYFGRGAKASRRSGGRRIRGP